MWKFLALVTGFVLLVRGGTATAQCASTCNESGTYWHFNGVSDSRAGEIHSLLFGMVFINNAFAPAVCIDDKTYFAARSWLYAGATLLGDASICTGAAHETIRFVPPGTQRNCAGVTFFGIRGNGYTLTVSSGAGTDSIWGPDFKANLCGGPGNDAIQGTLEYQYVSGGGGNDSLSGGQQDDNVRGNSDYDTLVHNRNSVPNGGTDKLRGEDGIDCLDGDLPITSDSSCGPGNDSWAGQRRAADCETFAGTYCVR